VDAVKTLDASIELDDRHLRALQLGADRTRQLVDDRFGGLAFRFDADAETFVRFRLQVLERQLLELVLDLAHAEPVGNRGVDVERFLGDLEATLVRQVMQRAHVVKPVRQLHQDDPDVIHHRQQHLPVVFRLPLLTR
jgi:hypothetical protein